MLTGIPWSRFFETIALAGAVYYIAVIAVYFRSEIAAALSARRLKGAAAPGAGRGGLDAPAGTVTPADPALEDLFNELSLYIQDAGSIGSPKEEVLFALERMLSGDRFILLRKPSLRDAADLFIREELTHYCSMHLSDEEMKRVWIGR